MHEKFNQINESFTRVRSPSKPTPEQIRARLFKKCLHLVDTLEEAFLSAQTRFKVHAYERLEHQNNRLRLLEAK